MWRNRKLIKYTNENTLGIQKQKIIPRDLWFTIIPFLLLQTALLAFPIVFFYENLSLAQCAANMIYLPTIALIAFMFALIPVILYSIYHVNDAFGIRFEYALNFSVCLVLFVGYIVNLFVKTVLFPRPYQDTLAIALLLFSNGMTVIFPLGLVYFKFKRERMFKIDADTFIKVVNDPILFLQLKKVRLDGIKLKS